MFNQMCFHPVRNSWPCRLFPILKWFSQVTDSKVCLSTSYSTGKPRGRWLHNGSPIIALSSMWSISYIKRGCIIRITGFFIAWIIMVIRKMCFLRYFSLFSIVGTHAVTLKRLLGYAWGRTTNYSTFVVS